MQEFYPLFSLSINKLHSVSAKNEFSRNGFDDYCISGLLQDAVTTLPVQLSVEGLTMLSK